MMLLKYLCFLLAFSFLQEIAAAIICLPFDFSNGFLFLVLLLAECAAFGGIGFFLAVLLRNPEWSLTMILCMEVGDYGSQGILFGILHFALYWYEDLTFAMVLPRMAVAGGIGIVAFAAAGCLLAVDR
jgi:hypothetical protein